MPTTSHTVRVLFVRDDRPEPVDAGTHTFHGEDYELFDERAARARILADGDLVIGAELVTFGGTIVPTAKIDRVGVEIIAKSRPSAE